MVEATGAVGPGDRRVLAPAAGRVRVHGQGRAFHRQLVQESEAEGGTAGTEDGDTGGTQGHRAVRGDDDDDDNGEDGETESDEVRTGGWPGISRA